jgi:hypothetical protein
MKLNRRCLFFALAMLLSMPVAYTGSQALPYKDPLLFPRDAFTVETKTVRTSSGERKVTYGSYLHIPYVANPVDKDYRSLNVSVPTKVDDTIVDASNAPILFIIGIGRYMSSNNARGSMGGFPEMPPRYSGTSRSRQNGPSSRKDSRNRLPSRSQILPSGGSIGI